MKKKSNRKDNIGQGGKARRGIVSLGKFLSLMFSSCVKFLCLLIGLIGVSLLFLGMHHYLLTSPHIQLRQVAVEGVEEELKRELIEMADLQYDHSLFAVNVKSLKERLEKHPWIRSIELEKQYPHTLIIHAAKEVPVAVVAAERLFYMDDHGRMFKEVTPGDDLDYPVVTGAAADGDEAGLRLAGYVLEVLGSVEGDLGIQSVSEIHTGIDETVTIYFISIPAAITVKGRELHRKLDELRMVVDDLNQKGRLRMVGSINLDYGDGAVVSMRKSQT